MESEKERLDRRDFLKTVGATGIALGSAAVFAAASLRAASPKSGATMSPAVAAAEPIMKERREGSDGSSSSGV